MHDGTSGRTVLIQAPVLHGLMRACFEGLGVGEGDATSVADALIYADLRGIDSHGFDRLPTYMRRVKAGLAGGSESVAIVARHGALCRLDAGHALGPAAAVKAVDLAAEIADTDGVGLVAVGNGTNLGAAGFYALRAARRRLIGIVTGNAPKMMAPHGAREAFLGSNAIAIAIPMGDRDDFLLDMASTVSARGKIRRAGALGEPIESGVALDANGEPTTDPLSALAGVMLPMGGPKGAGLALAIALLVGILAEADFDDEVVSIYDADLSRPQNLGQVFLVVDPWRVTDRDRVNARLAQLVDRLHGLRSVLGFDVPRYAGEGAAQRAREREDAGIPVPIADIETALEACSACELPAVAREFAALISP
jgi:LDH2 family malate/lactate/ureidoglycolate dehydrogenase